jgi:hypothetical protein
MNLSLPFRLITSLGILALAVLGISLLRAQTEAPSGLTVKFENDRVRVLELRLKPGQSERQHSHPQYVLYPLTDYTVRNTAADGRVRTYQRKEGEVFWGGPITHSGENVGTTELRAIIVELKPTTNP